MGRIVAILQACYRFVSPRLAIVSLMAATLLAFLFHVGFRINYNTAHIDRYHQDEAHTIYWGITYIKDGKIPAFRALETSRWIARSAYPLALVYMNQRMGGNVWTDTWNYPGHRYILARYIPQPDMADPNLRDFFYAMRLCYVLLTFASFLPLFWMAYRYGYHLVPWGMAVCLGLNIPTINEQSIFYIEPSMIIFINLMIAYFLYCLSKERFSLGFSIVYGIAGAAMVCTKPSTVFYLCLPVISVFNFWKHHSDKERTLQICIGILVFAAAFYCINIPAWQNNIMRNMLIHDVTSNFWNYSTLGNVEPGRPHFLRVYPLLAGLFGLGVFMFFPVVIGGLVTGKRVDRIILSVLLGICMISILALIKQRFFSIRNYVPYFPSLVFVVFTALSIIARWSLSQADASRKWLGLGTVGLFIVMCLFGIFRQSGGSVSAFARQIHPDPEDGLVERCRVIGTLDGNLGFFVVGADRARKDELSQHIDFVELEDVPPFLSKQSFPEYIKETAATLAGRNGVLVKRTGNNFQLTNYLLPRLYSKNEQFGAYYLFYSPRVLENEAAQEQ